MRTKDVKKGDVFGRLTVINTGFYKTVTAKEHLKVRLKKIHQSECKCYCGAIIVTNTCSLISGKTTTCRCRGVGHIPKRVRRIYQSMMSRCYKQNHDRYDYYGGRGIKVCDRWNGNILNFYEDMSQGYDDSLSIDRIDNNKGYEKSNCRWVTQRDQILNRGVMGTNTLGIKRLVPVKRRGRMQIMFKWEFNGKVSHKIFREDKSTPEDALKFLLQVKEDNSIWDYHEKEDVFIKLKSAYTAMKNYTPD